MERKSVVRSISNGVNQILGQYAARRTMDVDTVNEITARLNSMLGAMWCNDHIAGWDNARVEATAYAINACVYYTITEGDKQLEPCYLVMRMSQKERDALLKKINILSEQIDHGSAFDRAMKGVEQCWDNLQLLEGTLNSKKE